MSTSSVGLTLALSILGACASAGQEPLALEVGGVRRTFLERVPTVDGEARPAPLLLVLHGGGGSAAQAQAAFGFDRLVEREGVLIAYPDALEGHWNDGRGGEKFARQDASTDDVAFCAAVVADMRARHAVDPQRILAVGISNGGMFAQRLALERSDLFSAVASVVASMPAPLGSNFAPEFPVSVLFMNGSEDPIVPFGGGEVIADLFPRLGRRPTTQGRGRVLPTQDAAALWARRAGLALEPRIELLPDSDPEDGTRVELWRWGEAGDPVEVLLYRVLGGGHTLPGGRSRLPARVVGRTCRDIDGVEVIWSFLAAQRRPESARIDANRTPTVPYSKPSGPRGRHSPGFLPGRRE